jgi:hypothetical protein
MGHEGYEGFETVLKGWGDDGRKILSGRKEKKRDSNTKSIKNV